MSKTNYSNILKSSSLIGGSQGINMLIGMVSTKFVALLIGPLGIGLLSLYQTIQGFASTLTGLGIGSSGVRDIAAAYGANDSKQVALTVITLRRVCWITGLAGAALLAGLAPLLSNWIFDSLEHTTNIRLLSISLLFGNLSAGQSAVIQGTRRITDLAKMGIISAFLGAIISIGFYSSLGIEGVIPAIITLSVISWVISSYYASKIPIKTDRISWSQSLSATNGLIQLGVAFMWNGLLLTGISLLTRIMIAGEFDMVAVGIYAAAFNLSGKFVSFILSAMGADYYPSLTAINHDNPKMVDLVNQQTEIGILLALPGLIATMLFAPYAIELFYSAQFYAATDLLRWFVIGCLGRVISWPMGFVILAKGNSKLFITSETIGNIAHLVLIYVGLRLFGVLGVAIAFCSLYVFYTLLMQCICRRLIHFKWSSQVIHLTYLSIGFTVASFAISKSEHMITVATLGGILTIMASIYSLKGIANRLDPQHRLNRAISRIPFSYVLIGR